MWHLGPTVSWRYSPSKHKTFVYHLYNASPTSSAFDQHCINVIQIFSVCWAGCKYECKKTATRQVHTKNRLSNTTASLHQIEWGESHPALMECSHSVTVCQYGMFVSHANWLSQAAIRMGQGQGGSPAGGLLNHPDNSIARRYQSATSIL